MSFGKVYGATPIEKSASLPLAYTNFMDGAILRQPFQVYMPFRSRELL